MNKSKLKRKECLAHRQVQYEKALDGLIAGTIPPEYVHERWLKLKQLSKNKRGH